MISVSVNVEYLTCYMIVDVFCVVLTFVVATTLRNDSGSETQVKYFRWLYTSYLAFVVSDAAWALLMFGGFGEIPRVVPAALNGVNKFAATLAAYFWFCYGEAQFESPFVYNRRMRLLAAVPVALVIPLYVIGYVFGLNYVFVEGEGMVNGPTYIAVTIIGLLYLLAATMHSIVELRRAETQGQRRMCLVFIAFMIAPAAGAAFDAVIPNMPIMAPAMMVSILLVLLQLQESRISSDALTGLNNRRRADVFLEECVARASEEAPVYLFIIDMDRFKSINDTYGHLEGDRALQLMATALRHACGTFNSFAARWGGDEFVMICTHSIGDDPAHVIGVIKARLADVARENEVAYRLACSVGCARCDSPDEPVEQLVAEADRALYIAKG